MLRENPWVPREPRPTNFLDLPLRLCVRFFLPGPACPVRRVSQPEQHLPGFRHQ
jgi:hypothetical protein